MNTITATMLFWTLGRRLHHKYTVGDRVRITKPSPRHRLQGVIVVRYGRLESIPRLREGTLGGGPWTELMYTVQLDGTNPEVENPDVIEQSWVDLLTTSPEASPALAPGGGSASA